MPTTRQLWTGLLAAALLAGGCPRAGGLPDDERTRRADRRVRAAWGKPLADLPTRTLVIISPHNENIRNEYEWAFSLHHAVRYGQKVVFEWRDVGGGGSAITHYLQNVYGRGEAPGIDVLWGGGEFVHIPLADKGVLVPLALSADVLANVPAELGGVRMMDPQRRWVGTAVSAFGFVYNAGMLRRCGIAPPADWADLGDRRFAGLLCLADPTQSGSAAATYQMIVRSGRDWPDGWAKLLAVLSNAKRFAGGAGQAANAPLLGEALVAACIDFYGAMRSAEAPDQIVYVSPRGQTTFGPDPIAILKGAPHPDLASRFVDFVMSARGQALWALPVGAPDGPVRSALARQPIRRDVYDLYRGKMLEAIVDPFRAGQTMELSGFRKRIHFGVLRQLVAAAAVDNLRDLRAAKRRLIAGDVDPRLLAAFNRLPDNVATLQAMRQTGRSMKDPADRERIVTAWQQFFRAKYRRIAEAPGG
jgi:ABC-type Fe3+ transport system substrate-binding protein